MSDAKNGQAPPTEKRVGRPTLKTPELLAEIVGRVRKGETILAICRDADMPAEVTIYEWIDQDSEFAKNLARARESAAEVWAEEAIQFADDLPTDETLTSELVQRARLRSQNRIIMAGKFNRRFADKPGDVNVSAQVLAISPEKLRELQERSREAELLPPQSEEEKQDG